MVEKQRNTIGSILMDHCVIISLRPFSRPQVCKPTACKEDPGNCPCNVTKINICETVTLKGLAGELEESSSDADPVAVQRKIRALSVLSAARGFA